MKPSGVLSKGTSRLAVSGAITAGLFIVGVLAGGFGYYLVSSTTPVQSLTLQKLSMTLENMSATLNLSCSLSSAGEPPRMTKVVFTLSNSGSVSIVNATARLDGTTDVARLSSIPGISGATPLSSGESAVISFNVGWTSCIQHVVTITVMGSNGQTFQKTQQVTVRD